MGNDDRGTGNDDCGTGNDDRGDVSGRYGEMAAAADSVGGGCGQQYRRCAFKGRFCFQYL